MSVKIRLARRGRKKNAMYDVVVADARAPRDGRFIEKLGTYNPNTDPATINLDSDKAFDWVMKGAQPTDTVRAMLAYRGIMMRKHLQGGVNKGAITQEEADSKMEAWLKAKEDKIQGKVEKLAQSKADTKKAAFDAETKVKEARAEALKKRSEEATAALVEEIKEGGEAPIDEALEEDAAVVEEAQAEAKTEETPKEEAKAEEAPATEEKKEEAPAKEEPKAEAPKEEEKAEEAPAAEDKKEG